MKILVVVGLICSLYTGLYPVIARPKADFIRFTGEDTPPCGSKWRFVCVFLLLKNSNTKVTGSRSAYM